MQAVPPIRATDDGSIWIDVGSAKKRSRQSTRAPKNKAPRSRRDIRGASTQKVCDMDFSIPAADVLQPFSAEQFGALNPRQREALATAAVLRALFDPTGGEIGSRDLAAHHEAGHAVVAKALGYSIGSVRVGLHPTLRVWTGYTTHHLRGESSGVCVPEEEPDVAERIATVTLAGFVAEARLKPLHPTSSMDERFRAAIACFALDDAAGCNAGTTLQRVIDRVCRLIECNLAAFDAIVDLLSRERRPNTKQLAQALRPIKLSSEFARHEAAV